METRKKGRRVPVWSPGLAAPGTLAGMVHCHLYLTTHKDCFPEVITGKIKDLERDVVAYFSCVSPSIVRTMIEQCYFNVKSFLKKFSSYSSTELYTSSREEKKTNPQRREILPVVWKNVFHGPWNNFNQKNSSGTRKGSKKIPPLARLCRAFQLPRCSAHTLPCLTVTTARQESYSLAY